MPLAQVEVDKTSGDWMWTAASVLALRTPELEFNPAKSPTELEAEVGLSYMEAFVQKLLAGSFQDSALFWHYALRHVPSDSLMCAREDLAKGSSKLSSNASVIFVDDIGLSGKDPSIVSQAPLRGYPMHGYAAFPIGSASKGCLCGWPLNAKMQCEVPWPSMCVAAGIPLASAGWACVYSSEEEESKILDMWQQEWPCPDTDFSDSWGIVPSANAEDWIKASTSTTRMLPASLSEAIYSGRAGLRVGNMQTIQNSTKSVMKPVSRGYAKAAAQHRCASNIYNTFDPVSVAKDIADDLIPAAQAVSTESWPVSVCIRFSIEFLRLRVLRSLEESMVNISSSERMQKLKEAANLQQAVVQSWKHKCESQLGMVAVCQSNSLFELVPEKPYAYACPFTISDAYTGGNYYVGPSSCLVYVAREKSFFDPCLVSSNPCTTKATVSLASILSQSSKTRLAFDVRSLGNGEVLGRWPAKFTSPDAVKNEVASAAATLLEDWRTTKTMGVPWRLSQAFAQQVLESSSSAGAVGNTKLEWKVAEGFANVTTDFCDGIADWWPEDWTQPVGYHATVPCSKDEAGYRVFDSVFAIDRESSSSVVIVKYMHSMVRDPEAYHSRFATAGFCRRGNYNHSQYVANTMRVCTRDVENVEYDATVPVAPKFLNPQKKFSDAEYCAPDAADVPWSMDDPDVADPGMFSVGNAPMWRGVIWEADGLYPDGNRLTELENTSPGLRSTQSWSSACSSMEKNVKDVLSCSTDADCVALPAAAANGTRLECFRGICVLNRKDTDTCYSHADCQSTNKMCAGDGRCVHSVLQVENALDHDIDFELYSEDCSSSNSTRFPTVQYDTYGGSPWEKIPDVLEMYGMCSYRNWFSYLEFVEPSSDERQNLGLCNGEQQSSSCEPLSSKSTVSRWYNVLTPEANEMPSLWDTQKFRVQPHACDRDYQHLNGMRGCAPSFSMTYSKRNSLGHVSLETAKRIFFYKTKSTYAQTINRDKYAAVGLGKPSFFTAGHLPLNSGYRKAGFLSAETVFDVDAADATDGGKSIFTACKTLEQCFVDDFFYNGKMVARKIFDQVANVMRDWKPMESERCGSFGYQVDEMSAVNVCPGINQITHACCRIDMSVAPLYYTLKQGSNIKSLDDVCNNGLLLDKFPKLSIFSMDAVTHHMDNIKEIYVVPLKDKTARKATLASIRDSLNSIMDEFTPDFAVDTAFKYIQVVDCSLAVYRKMQEFTTCPEAQKVSNSKPTGDAASQTAASQVMAPAQFCSPYEAASPYRSGMYFFLDYTMVEVPFAWWYKCMLLKSRSFSTQLASIMAAFGSSSPKAGIIQCDEWHVLSIPESKLQKSLSSFVGGQAARKILAAEGGITSQSVLNAVDAYKQDLLKSIDAFKDGGSPLQTDTTGMKRQGISSSYGMECFSKTRFPKDVDRFKAQVKPRDCIQDMLWWKYNEGSNKFLWADYAYAASSPLNSRGGAGADRSCYSLEDRDLVPAQGETRPMQRISDMASFLLPKDLALNDFMQQGSYNTPVDGLLVAELMPRSPPFDGTDPALLDQSSSVAMSVTKVLDPVSNEAEFKQAFDDWADPSNYPCIKIEDIEGRLPACDGDTIEPVKLTIQHCSSMKRQSTLAIIEYSRSITSYPSSFPKRQWPPPDINSVYSYYGEECKDYLFLYDCPANKYHCMWDCGSEDNDFPSTVHLGLKDSDKKVLLGMVDVLYDTCKQHAKEGTYLYEDPNKMWDADLEKLVDEMKTKQEGITTQEVCGNYKGHYMVVAAKGQKSAYDLGPFSYYITDNQSPNRGGALAYYCLESEGNDYHYGWSGALQSQPVKITTAEKCKKANNVTSTKISQIQLYSPKWISKAYGSQYM